MNLTQMDGFDPGQIAEYVVRVGTDVVMNVVFAAIILIAGLFIAGLVGRNMRRALSKSERIDATLVSLFSNLARYAIVVVVIVAVLGRFGIETTSIVAALGAAVLAIGLALQGTLSNVAAGVMIVLFRPYKLGDFVELAGVMGTVKEITLFFTELNTTDNKQLIVPNGQAWGNVITNFSAYPTRRADFTFSISYDDDIDKAQKVIREVFEADDRVLKDPELFCEVSAHGGSSIDLTVRAWTKAADLWPGHFHMLKAVKQAFDREGIEIPYPHQVEIQKKG